MNVATILQRLSIWFASLISLVFVATAGCQSAEQVGVGAMPTPNPAPTSRSACQKADSMWNDKIVSSRYAQLPALTSPGFLDLLKLITGHFALKALTTQGDELEAGRSKLIHAFGAEARLRLVIDPAATDSYTGIFHSGAPCVIGRFSLATKPAQETAIPGLALKIFIDGDQPSVNLLLMHSIDDQAGHNYFAQTFSNILPAPRAFAKRMLASSFERSAVQFGAKDPNPGRLTLENLAGIQANGQRIGSPRTPYQILFKPTVLAYALMQGTSAQDDFRLLLAGLAVGQAVYDIYTLDEGNSPENARLLGQLVLTAPVVSSRYGDDKLYFQHNMARQ